MGRPMSVDQVVALLQERGDTRSVDALRVYVNRTINDGTLAGYKVNPGRQTSPWQMTVEDVQEWLDVDQETESKMRKENEPCSKE